MDVLRVPEALSQLLGQLEAADRLVLLGDVVELRQAPAGAALSAAEPILASIGQALGESAEVVVVPGNHDHNLLAAWFARRSLALNSSPLDLQTEITWQDAEPLAAVAQALAPAHVQVRYPGVWLGEGVYATHGHYCDVHTTVPMLERLAAGAMAQMLGFNSRGPARSEDYEAILSPVYAWIDALAQHGGPRLARASHGTSAQIWRTLEDARKARGLRGSATIGGFRLLVAALNRMRLRPLKADVSAPELRRAGLKAFSEVLERLEVSADHVIFGHTHRAGPLAGDEPHEWQATGTQLLNTGCWVRETPPGRTNNPYRPGFAVLLDGDDPPELVNLLDRRPGPA